MAVLLNLIMFPTACSSSQLSHLDLYLYYFVFIFYLKLYPRHPTFKVFRLSLHSGSLHYLSSTYTFVIISLSPRETSLFYIELSPHLQKSFRNVVGKLVWLSTSLQGCVPLIKLKQQCHVLTVYRLYMHFNI